MQRWRADPARSAGWMVEELHPLKTVAGFGLRANKYSLAMSFRRSPTTGSPGRRSAGFTCDRAKLDFGSAAICDCRSVELRALCNEVPRTPPGPEGSNGTGIASCAPDHPKFLALKKSWSLAADRRFSPTPISANQKAVTVRFRCFVLTTAG